MNMNWLSTAIRKQKMVKESPGTTKSLSSSWRITPELDESSHDSFWDISKSHNRMIRVGKKHTKTTAQLQQHTLGCVGSNLILKVTSGTDKLDFLSQWKS